MAFQKITIQKPKEGLGVRQAEVLTLVAQGKTRAEIAIILNLSEDTVKVYVERACRKLNAVNNVQAVSKAIVLGLIEPYVIGCPSNG